MFVSASHAPQWAEHLGVTYLESLYGHFRAKPLYIVSSLDEPWYRKRIRIANPSAHGGLFGAGLFASQRLAESQQNLLPCKESGRVEILRDGWRVGAEEQKSYRVISCSDLLNKENSTLATVGFDQLETGSRRRLLVIDEQVLQIHGSRIKQYFEAYNLESRIFKTNIHDTNYACLWN